MFECFNEGFTDEERDKQSNSLLPKIEVSFPNAHLQPICVDKTHLLLSPQIEVSLPDKIHVVDQQHRQNSDDKNAKDTLQKDMQNRTDLDQNEYLQTVFKVDCLSHDRKEGFSVEKEEKKKGFFSDESKNEYEEIPFQKSSSAFTNVTN